MLVLIRRKKNFDESHLLLDNVEVHSSIAGNILVAIVLSKLFFYKIRYITKWTKFSLKDKNIILTQ